MGRLRMIGALCALAVSGERSERDQRGQLTRGSAGQLANHASRPG